MGNPLACAVASANLDLLAARDTAAEVHRIEGGLAAGLERAASLASVAEVRVLGAVGVVQLREPVRVAEVTAAAIERGVWVRPFRDLVYTMPPYVTSDDDLALLTSALVGAVESVHG
jgi:adenosylmethionine-8-amino-7-oxononanoate aminotransferase